MEFFIDRLQYYMREKGINNNQMTVSAGLSVGLIGRAIKTKSGLNSDSIEKILYSYPDLNPNWLLTGRGNMLIDLNDDNKNREVNREVSLKSGDKNVHPNVHLSPKSEENNKEVKYSIKLRKEQLTTPAELLMNKTHTSVPFYNLPVSAGMLGVLESEIFTQSEPDGFLELSVFDGCEAVFPIVGVSMVPIIHSGDWIGIQSIENLSHSWDFIQTDVIYLIITREDRMIKFIDKATDEDFIICRSSNASPFKLFKGDILKIYRIKACVKRL